MFEKVVRFIRENKMIMPGDRIVIGFSGGADSMALLHILNRIKDEIGLEISAAHINHGLRGDEAAEDAKFCEAFCNEWNIPFYIKEVNIKSLSKDLSLSVEEAGRRSRYLFFKEILEKTGSDKIATAHHKNDQAETILYNIIRGTGIQGLGGIKPVREGSIIRPLLCVTRDEIEKYLRDNRLNYRIDYTNEDTVFTRNRIRHELIPYMEKHFNPSFVDTVDRLGQVAREENDFVTEYCTQLVPRYFNIEHNKVEISLDFLENHPSIQKRLVRLGINMFNKSLKDISYKHIDDAISLANVSRPGSKLMLPNGICILKNYNTLDILLSECFNEIKPFDMEVPVPGTLSVSEINIAVEVSFCPVKCINNTTLRADSSSVYIDRNAVKGKLRIRQRREGDRFVPYGMKGSKKLKDYFIDKKVPRAERDRIPLIVDNVNIIWVVGYQISELYKVKETTQEVINIKVYEMEDFNEGD